MPALNFLPLPRVSHPKRPGQTDGLPTLPGPCPYLRLRFDLKNSRHRWIELHPITPARDRLLAAQARRQHLSPIPTIADHPNAEQADQAPCPAGTSILGVAVPTVGLSAPRRVLVLTGVARFPACTAEPTATVEE